MTPAEFLRTLKARPTTHFYAVTPDGAGLALLVPRILRGIAAERDVRILDGSQLTVRDARRVAQEAGMSPVAGGPVTHFVVWRAHDLKPEAAGALLLAIEEAARGRFAFVAARDPRGALRPLASRCVLVRLPFLSKRAVLGNLQVLRLDARTADERDLWDGTLGGTLANLREEGDRRQILEALHRGMNGLADLVACAGSPVFDRVMREHLTEEERRFLDRESSPERRKLVAFSALARRDR